MFGIRLHGICYDFFFVTGQIFVDQKSTDEIRGQAQGFLVLLTYGVGMLVGAQISGWIFNRIVPDPAVRANWQTFWILPAAFAFVVLIYFALCFENTRATDET